MKKGWLVLTLLILYLPSFGLDGNGTAGNGYRGPLTGNFTFGPGEIYIDGEVAIKTFTLTVVPGTTLIISDAGQFRVYDGGRIMAIGTQVSPIYFRAGGMRWGHIRFYNNTVSSEFEYCTFENGKSLSDYPDGGAIMILNSPNIRLESCTFLSNTAIDNGTGHAAGGAISAVGTVGLTIINCTFQNNSALEGGAISLYNAESEIIECTFEGNSAIKLDGRGGAIYVHAEPSYEVLIDRSKIYSNSSVDRTGGIHFDTGSGGTVQNSLIYGNNSSVGGGVNMGSTGLPTDGTVDIVNCVIVENNPCDITFRTSIGYSVRNSVLWGSDASVMYIPGHGGGPPVASNLINCAVQGATDRDGSQIDIESTFINSFKLNSLNNHLDGPNFADPMAHDYRINFTSPCRDKGTLVGTPATPLSDFLGRARIGDCDIGAYEIQYSRWIGSSDDIWNTVANWDKDLYPLIGTGDIIITSGCINYPTGLDYNDFVIDVTKYLIIEPGAKITFNDLTNNGSLLIKSSSYNNSGSLILTGISTGGGIVTYERSLPEDGANPLWHYVSSPINATNTTSTKNFYPWDEVGGEWGKITESIESGIGYTVTANGSISFTGSLNTSEFGVFATSPYSEPFEGTGYFTRPMEAGRGYGGGGWNLLGNPYTSAVNVTRFIEANFNMDWNLSKFDPNYVALYLYNGSSYQYVTKDETGWATSWPNGTYLDAECIQAGQAFFVLAMSDGAEFSFSPSMQEHMPGVALLKSANSRDRWPGIALTAKRGNTETETIVMFHNDMSIDLDPSFDIGHMSGGTGIEIYTKLLADNGVNFVRQALPLLGAVKLAIPVGLDFPDGGIVTLSADIEPLRSYKFWLEDRTIGTFTDLETNSYTVNLPVMTNGTGRFFIHVAAARNTRPEPNQHGQQGLRIWASQNRHINVQGPVSEKALCEVFDAVGHKIYEKRLSEGEFNTFSIPSKLQGIYVLKVTDQVRTSITKVIFH